MAVVGIEIVREGEGGGCCRAIVPAGTVHRSLGPSVGDPTAMYTPPLKYKREEYVKLGRGGHNTSSDSLRTIPFSTS